MNTHELAAAIIRATLAKPLPRPLRRLARRSPEEIARIARKMTEESRRRIKAGK